MIFFFIAGLLLHLECVPLGAYRIPPGAGLLIPSRKNGMNFEAALYKRERLK
jgi:hypothetical protein